MHKWNKEIKAFLDDVPIQCDFANRRGWMDNPRLELADFDNPNYRFRITIKKRSVGHVFYKIINPQDHFTWPVNGALHDQYTLWAKAFLTAYKNGEIDEDCNC